MIQVSDLFIDAPGGRRFARIWGDLGAASVPIILLHDSLGSVELWRNFPARLAEVTGRTVVAYDRLGFGRSDPYPGTLDADFIREESRSSLPALRAQLGIPRMILFGHSVGGGMSVCAGAALPDSVVAVITESAQAFVEDRTLAGIREAEKGFEEPGQIERLARYHGDKARWVLEAWTGTWQSPRFADWALDAELRGLHCPVLALHGDRDEYGSRLHPERIGSLPPGGGEVVIFEDCGHVPHREKPEAVLQAVTNFTQALS
jgi:pimeloyl-ACP methyl ester carboxylesterase